MRVGIDLGTTYSLVGHLNGDGTPTLIGDAEEARRFQTPSVVHVERDWALVGSEAEEMLEAQPDLPVTRFAKMSMGHADPLVEDAAGRAWPPEAVSALILKKLLADVEVHTGQRPTAATIAVPAQFGDPARRATKAAAHIAGIGDVELVEEPVAAATYYGLGRPGDGQTLFVYDLGGGTFDATVLHAEGAGLYVLATAGTNDVGGRDFDRVIMRSIAEAFRERHGIDPLQDPVSCEALQRTSRGLKLEINQPGTGQVSRTLLLAGKTLEYSLTRRQFERLAAPLLQKTREVCERCLEGAALDWSAMDKVLLTGGGSFLPGATQLVRRLSGLAGDRFVMREPHEAVAYGATLLAAEQGLPTLERTVASCELGFRTRDKNTGVEGMKTIVPHNAPLPATHNTTLYTTRDDQTRIVLDLVQRREEGAEPESLGCFLFGPIRRPRKNYPIEVSLKYDSEGLVTVAATDPASGESLEQSMRDDDRADWQGVPVWQERIADLAVNP